MINVDEIKDFRMLQADCFEVLKEIPDHSINPNPTGPP